MEFAIFTEKEFYMDKNSWIEEMHQIVKEKNGAVTEEDAIRLRESMKISNDDVSAENVEFKRHRSYF